MQNNNIFSQLEIGKEYQILISIDDDGKRRLSQGFIFTENQALYPTVIKISKLSQSQNAIYGKLRDNDNPNFFLSWQPSGETGTWYCGYDNKGDEVKIVLQQLCYYKDQCGLWTGTVHVINKELISHLKYSKDNKHLCADMAQQFFINITTKPVQLKFIFIINNYDNFQQKTQKQTQLIRDTKEKKTQRFKNQITIQKDQKVQIQFSRFQINYTLNQIKNSNFLKLKTTY